MGTFDEGNTIFNYVKEKANSSPYIWINYSDIHVTASLVGLQNEPMFVNSTYVGSLSTLAKLPKEMWRTTREEGNNRQRGNNCIVWLKTMVSATASAHMLEHVCARQKSHPILKSK